MTDDVCQTLHFSATVLCDGGGGATGRMLHLVGGATGVALSHADMTPAYYT